MNNIIPATDLYRPLRDLIRDQGLIRQLINQGNKKCLVMDTPYNRPDANGVPFDQITHFEQLDQIHSDIWPDGFPAGGFRWPICGAELEFRLRFAWLVWCGGLGRFAACFL